MILKKYQNEKIRVTTQFQVSEGSIVLSLKNLRRQECFLEFLKETSLAEHIFTPFLSGRALGSYSLQRCKKNCHFLDFPKKLLR